MPKPIIPLPDLPFGARVAFEDLDAAVMSERLSRGGATMDYRAAEPGGAFRSVSSMARVGSVQMIATASTAVEFDAKEPPRAILILPLAGGSRVTQDKREVIYYAEKSALYLPAIGCSGYSTQRSAVGIDIVPEQLESLACHMLGRDPGGAPLLDLAGPRELPLVVGRIRFDQIFRHLTALVDHYLSAPDMLELSGLDDTIRRSVVMLLKPELFFAQEDLRPEPRPKIADLCEYIRANLNQKITLTMMEEISGLSPRVLQYAFREKYGCSPMHWVSDQRLDVVRSLILAAPPGTKLSDIAAPYFSNLGEFAQKYRRRFGELPSRTMASRRIREPVRPPSG